MLFYLVGSDVRQAHDQPHASLCHELAGQWINLSTNSFKAQAQPGRPGGLCRPWPGEGPAVPGLFEAVSAVRTPLLVKCRGWAQLRPQ